MNISWEEFAQVCTDVLRAKGEVRPIQADRARDRLMVGEVTNALSFVHLLHARREWDAASPGEKPKVLFRRFWSSIKTSAAPDSRRIHDGVVLRVRDRAWFSALRRQAELELGPDEHSIEQVVLPHLNLNEELAAHLAFDLPSSVTEIGWDRLTAWGFEFDDLYAQARKNLLAASTVPLEAVKPGVYVSPFHDTLDASRMVLHELFTDLKVKGRPVVIAPTHDTLFVTGEDDVGGLMQVAQWASDALQLPRAHSALAFVLSGSQWTVWQPPAGHPALPLVKVLALQTRASAYSRQKDVLDALIETSGLEILVATLRAFRTATGDLFSACAWQEGLEALLPETDRIDFVRPGEPSRVWSTSFDVARATVGHLMTASGDFPPRWRVSGFPTDIQLEEMAAAGTLP
jgi:hypothetical protein